MASTAITTQTLEPDTFARKVMEERLVATGPYQGYVYAQVPGQKDAVLYRTHVSRVWAQVEPTAAATADPAAGADPAVITVPTGKRWLLTNMYLTLVTDANAANRQVYLTVTADGTNAVFAVTSATAHTANQTRYYSFGGHGIPGTLITTTFQIPIPVCGIEIPAGGTIAVTVTNIQVGDDMSAVRYVYKEMNAE